MSTAIKTFKKFSFLLIILTTLIVGACLTAVITFADTFYTVRIEYKFSDGTPAHDSYVAAYRTGANVNTTVTNPNITGYTPMTALENGDSAITTHLEYSDLNENKNITVYYIAGLTKYRAMYYKQNVYDDLYTRDNTLESRYTDRYGYTGSNPTDLEDIEFPGFTNLFHEPDAIAADGSTVFRVYYDRNYYTVDFDLGDGGYGVDTVYSKYESVFHISEPKRPGYSFKGWVRTNENGDTFYDEDDNEITAGIGETLEDKLKEKAFTMYEGEIPAHNLYYKAIWEAANTRYSIVYWMENPDSTTSLEEMQAQTTSHDLRQIVTRNYSAVATKEFNNVPSDTEVNYEEMIKKYDFFYEYDSVNDKLSTTDSDLSVDFPTMSPADLNDLNGHGKYFELNTFLTQKNFYDSLLTKGTLPNKVIKGDGTTRINVYYDRKDFNLKFFYAREELTNGEPNGKISLTNSTKGFSKNSYSGMNYQTALAMEAGKDGAWQDNIADSLPHLKSKYTDPQSDDYIPGLEELHEDYADSRSRKNFRYYYYQVSAKYDESLKNKWLVDALTDVHKKGDYAATEMCKAASWAVEYGTKYYHDHTGINNYTIKGFYERLGNDLMFRDRTTDYQELHYLVSWTNTSKSNNWNGGIARVLNFKYQNYTELLPKEIEQCENDPTNGPAAVKTSGGYTDVRQFTTQVNGQSTTKWYGLKPGQIINTIDSGDQYERSYTEAKRNKNVRLNQTAAELTGFKIENYRVYNNEDVDGNGKIDSNDTKFNGQIVLNETNTEIDWSEDTANDRHATINFFYRRLIYTLTFQNGGSDDRVFTSESEYHASYQSPLGRKYTTGEHAGEYIFYYEPEYPNPDLKDYYEFEGWYYTPYYYRKVDFNTATMPSDDIILYAHWVPKVINVSFYPTYNDYYEDTNRIHCIPNPDYDEENPDAQPRYIDGEIPVDYGDYVPNNQIPANITESGEYRPKLDPPAEGAQFAGWYYLRDNIPVRFEPENLQVTALNQEAAASNGHLKLFAEWVTRDVARYKVKYVEHDNPEREVADSTEGRSFVYKTKTFNAKGGEKLNADHAWEEDGTNWWPTTNSHSIIIKSNSQGNVYAPNEYTFEYIQKHSVHYKVRYLDASSRKPLLDETTHTSTYASVKADAPFIAGYVVTEGTKTLTLAASTKETEAQQEEEELNTNVITFYYNKNDTEYLYEVEYYKQNTGDNGYTLSHKENLAVPIASEGDTTISITDIYNRPLPKVFEKNGFTRKAGATTVTETNGSVSTYGITDNQNIVIAPGHRSTIKVYFDRNTYNYSYKYVDHTQEKIYNEKLQNGESVEGVWDGVIREFPNQGPERVEKDVTITADRDITYNGTPYTRISTNNITVNIAPVTISNPNVNEIKIYYRKFTERELQFKLSCKNEDSPYTEVDYDYNGEPIYGGISKPMQTIDKYSDIQSVEFYDFNDAKTTSGGVESYIHNHKYTFLGWYDNPEGTGTPLTTNEVLTKEDLGLNEGLPERDTTYYAVVEQVLVTANFEFRLVDEALPIGTGDGETEEDRAAAAIVASATSDPNGDYTGGYFDFSAPSTYRNNTPVPWHRTDGYSMEIKPKDNRVYKYEFAEWWEENLSTHNLIRKKNWNSSGEWSPTLLQNQVTRNGNKHIIAVYKKRDVTEIPYTINYHFKTRLHGEKDYVVKGTLSGDDLNEKKWIVNSWADAAPPTSPEGTNTVKFINKNNWDKVYLYAWDDDDENAQWPGVELTDKTTNESGEEVFTGTFNSNYTKLIFTNGSDETVDITYNSSVTGYYPVQKTALINTSGAYELTDNFIMSQAPYESNHGETLCWKDTNIVKTSEKGNSTAKSETAQTDRIITTVTAEQKVKKAYANYKIYPNQSFTSLQTEVGANRKTDEKLGVIDATGLTYEGKSFSYWEIRKSDSANAKVVARCYEPWFSFCIMDNYYITPVYDNKGNSASLDPSKIKENNEDWYAWTWNAGENGMWVTPTNGLTFQGLKDKVIFVRVKEGSGVPPTTWSISGDIWNQTSDLDVVNGGTYTVSGYSGTTMLGSWFNIKLTHLDYSRNRWTDNNGAIPSDGSTDELFTDFEIAFNNQFEAIHGENTGYKTGVVFELCAQLPDGVTFDQDKDYKAVSNEDNLKAKIKSSLESNTYYTTYSYKTNKNRNIQIKEIPTGNLTNKNRIQFGQGYVNKYTVTGTDESGNEIRKYTNSTYLLKAWAYLIDSDGNVTLSNPVYTCLNNISKKDFASGEAIGDVNMVNYTSGN